MAHLPKAVREAGERSDQLLKQAHEGGNPPAPGEDRGMTGRPEDDSSSPPSGKPEPAPAPGAGNDEELAALREQLSSLETKYRVLQGKYNAEVGNGALELRQRNQELTQQLETLQEQVQQLRKQVEEKNSDETLDELRKDMGEDHGLVKALAAQRQANAGLQSQVSELKATIAELKGQVDNTTGDVQDRAEKDFFRDLTKAASNWERINNDPRFHEWLTVPDPYSGETRYELLNRARRDLDAERAARFFNDFEKELASSKPPSMDNQVGDFAQPDARGGGGGESAKKVWTKSEINQFYIDTANDQAKPLGRRKYTEEQARELEADIMAAQSEGRIREG